MRSAILVATFSSVVLLVAVSSPPGGPARGPHVETITKNVASARDTSPRLDSMRVAPPETEREHNQRGSTGAPAAPPNNPAGAAVEQTKMGTRDAAILADSFDGIGVGFEGPQGTFTGRNPSANSLAVGPDHILQSVNTRMAVFTKKGKKYDTTGKVLWGPVPNNTVFADFGGTCQQRNNGDTVVRYDQLANRWLIVMPIFSRAAVRPDQPPEWKATDGAQVAPPGIAGQPGTAKKMAVPPPPPPPPPGDPGRAGGAPGQRPAGPPAGGPPAQPGGQRPAQPPPGPYAMCYAVSVTSDPLGEYYRYEFLRPLFPDYPRPAVWPDGYYLPSSTGDDVIQKHTCAVDRARMLKGELATEQCVVIDGVNFLNNADLDGTRLPPAGAPNVVLAAGGTQLQNDYDDDVILAWNFKVDWQNPSNTKVTGPTRIPVAPYHYLCNGQLTRCVPQPGTDMRLDAQGDKIMARVVYRNVDGREMVVAVHSVNTEAGGGGVRWYEFRINRDRNVSLFQQGTYAPDAFYRWMASPAIDKNGNIGIGYSFGGTPHFAGQRFAGRLANDPKGQLTLKETILREGEAAQTYGLRWEDYSQTAVDPSDDCTIWYVGDYYKKEATNYSTKIGAFRMPGCSGR